MYGVWIRVCWGKGRFISRLSRSWGLRGMGRVALRAGRGILCILGWTNKQRMNLVMSLKIEWKSVSWLVEMIRRLLVWRMLVYRRRLIKGHRPVGKLIRSIWLVLVHHRRELKNNGRAKTGGSEFPSCLNLLKKSKVILWKSIVRRNRKKGTSNRKCPLVRSQTNQKPMIYLAHPKLQKIEDHLVWRRASRIVIAAIWRRSKKPRMISWPLGRLLRRRKCRSKDWIFERIAR